MSQIDLNKLSEEEILRLIKDELSDDELIDAKDSKLCNVNINLYKCKCTNLDCSDCLFGKEKRSYVLEKLNIQKQLNLSDYSNKDIVEKLKTIYKYDDLGDLKNNPDSLCQIKGNPFYDCECGADCFDCILHTSYRFDLIQLLKDSKPKEIMENKPSNAIELMVIRRVHKGLDDTIQVDWSIGRRTWAEPSYKNSFTKDETIHPENNRYGMNVPAICFAPVRYSDFKGPFKVGDLVEITKSDFNWAPSMDKFVGKKVQITDVYNNGWSIKFKEDYDRFNWNYDQGHFIPCDPIENNVSRKYTIQELESDRNLVIYLDDISEFAKIKLYTTRLSFEYAGKYCYSLFHRTYASDSSKSNLGSYANQSTTILTINDIIFPEIQQPENSFICTLDQLKNKLDIVVFLETREEYEKLKVYIPNLIKYYGPYCYSILGRTYSSNSGKTYSGSYGNVKIVLFKNIIFPDTSSSEKTVYTEPPTTKKSISGREEIYIIPLPE